MTKILSYTLFFIIGTLSSCNETPLPKPRAFARIDRIDESRQKFSGEKFSFNYSKEALVEFIPSDDNSEIWINISYPIYNTTIHCSYIPVDERHPLRTLLDDSYHLAFSHSSKANNIQQNRIEGDDNNQTTVYYIGGDVATPIQFYVTDNTTHFFRGSVYYNQSVNSDSVASITGYMKNDILELARSLKWAH